MLLDKNAHVILNVFNIVHYFEQLDELKKMLSEIELERCKRFVFDRDRNTYIIAHGLLREKLGRQIGQDAKNVNIAIGDNGKPMLESGDVFFNLSHSNQWVAMAFSYDSELGVDVESTSPVRNWQEIVPNYFSDAEKWYIDNCSEAQQYIAFLKCWTRKEAVLKAKGTGLTEQLKKIETRLEYDECEIQFLSDQGYVTMHVKTSCTRQYVCSVALPNPFKLQIFTK